MKFSFTRSFWFSSIILMLFLSGFIYAQNPDWTKVIKYSGPKMDFLNDFTLDNSGNIYIVGAYQDSIKIDTTTIYSSANYFDMYVAKLNSDYKVQWAAHTDNYNGIGPKNIRVDDYGNVFVAGTFSDDLKFGSISLTGNDPSVFVAKLSSAGVWQWAEKGYEPGSTVYYDGFELDSQGNGYLGGYYIMGAHFGMNVLFNTGHTNLYAAKITSDGNWEWANQGVKVNGIAYGGIIKQSGDFLYETVNWSDTDKLILGEDTLTTQGNYLVELGTDGKWGKVIEMPFGAGVKFEDSNHMILTAQTWDSLTVGNKTFYDTTATRGDIIVSKYDGLNFDWAYQIKCTGTNYPQSMDIDNQGNIYFAGTFEDTIKFGNQILVGQDAYDVFVCKFSKDGVPQWIKSAGGMGYDRVYKIHAIGEDKILVGGYFEQDMNFGGIQKNSVGADDAYLAVINNSTVPVELTSFSAINEKGKVRLNWATATETNNSGFKVERSVDKKNFSQIGFVEGKGTTAEKSNYKFVDKSITNGNYFYRLKQINFDGSFEYSKIVEVSNLIPKKFVLEQNYPNPFNPSTTIGYSIPKDQNVELNVYDILGKKVIVLYSGYKKAGSYKINFNAKGLSSGIYFYSLKTSDKIITKKLVLLR